MGRVLCPIVIGREVELALLGDAIGLARTGQGSTIVLASHPEPTGMEV